MQDPDRQDRIAQAVARVEAGESSRRVSVSTGIPRTTIYRWADKWRSADADTKQQITDRLISQHVETALLASAEINRRLADPDLAAEISPKDLNALAGTSTDKLARYMRWERPAEHESASSALARLLDRLGDLESVTLTLADPAARAIDVTHEIDDEPPIHVKRTQPIERTQHGDRNEPHAIDDAPDFDPHS